MTDDSNITYLERVERHRLQLMRWQRRWKPSWNGLERPPFMPAPAARQPERRPLDEAVAEELKERAET